MICLLVGLLAAATASVPALAQDASVEAEPTALPENTALASDWQFALRPYFFLSGLSGSITVTPVTIPVNSGFTDLVGNLKLGGFISFTAEKGQWGGSVDLQYINLYGESSGQADNSVDLKNMIGEADLIFRPAAAPTLRFLAGLRVYSVGQTVTLLGQEIPEVTTTVVDPILGAYGDWQIHRKWGFELRGDIGGFGVSSEYTYQLIGLFKWHISGTVDIPFGYRILGYQIKKDSVRMNTRMTGLMLGCDIRF